jgi:carbonic anhydrase
LTESCASRLLLCATLALAGATAASAAPHWGYAGENGPDRWAKLSGEYGTCGAGQQQSPIDLAGATAKDVANPQFTYQAAEGRLLNNGHTVELDTDTANTLVLDGASFALQQLHFHSPSEHTINGSSFPTEIHLVHRAENGALVVVGVMVQVGAENPAIARMVAVLPAKAGKEARVDGAVDLNALLPTDRRAYRYSGSLTTPPCTEGVSWVVMSQPITASATQISMLARVLAGNSRPPQPRGSRELVLDSSP